MVTILAGRISLNIKAQLLKAQLLGNPGLM